MELAKYMNESIGRIVEEAISSSQHNKNELDFLVKAERTQLRAAQKRMEAEASGDHVPPFLIASIATRCNLRCAGCYARVNNACMDLTEKTELSTERWGELFHEAEEMGVSFTLIAGGEPLSRPDVLDEAAATGLICPVFTNGTLFSSDMLMRFDKNRNLIPVLSLEGDREQTDSRRGVGVYDTVQSSMADLKRLGIFYGVSLTVTKENLELVTDFGYISSLWESGCNLVFFVEYVPVEGSVELAPGKEERELMEMRLAALKEHFLNVIFISFPGDEKALGGCLAAGRGFFHINAFGDAEPCPFSPYSDFSLKTGNLRGALDSTLFRRILDNNLEAAEHEGGCALFARRSEVSELLHMA